MIIKKVIYLTLFLISFNSLANDQITLSSVFSSICLKIKSFLFTDKTSSQDDIYRNPKNVFSGYAISRELFEYIKKNLEPNKTILELGSGAGTGQLAKHYKMYSIEHDPKWVNKFDSTYIYAPIKNGWFDVEIVTKQLPAQYDMILIDGPPGNIGRHGFYDNLHLFNTNVMLIFDDVNRQPELILMQNVSKKLNRPYEIFKSGTKAFGVIK